MVRDRDFLRLVGLADAKKKLLELDPAVRTEMGFAVKRVAADVLAAAKRLAPVRSGPLPAGYTGGALRRHLAMRFSASNVTATLGIEQVAIVVRRGRAQTYARHRVKVAGKWRRRVMSQANARALRQGGALVIRPTKYGHLVEFGHRKGRSPAAAAPRSFMRAAVRFNQGHFEATLRRTSVDVERLLAARPSGPTGGRV